MYGLIGRIDAVPGRRDELAAILGGIGDMPGCSSYVVATDPQDPDALWVTEIWVDRAAHAASLELPAAREAIAAGRPLIAGFGFRAETEPISGVGGHGKVSTPLVTGPVLDSSDPVGLARFYERLLGWPIVEIEGPRPGYPSEDGWAKIRAPHQDLKIEFQYERLYSPPVWPPRPGEPQMMMHLDIEVDDLEVGVARAREAGAVLADHQPQDGVRVMLDPAGHPFCLFAAE